MNIRLDDVACEGFTNLAANKGYCVRLEALQTGNVVQYATVIDLKSRNTKVGLQCAGNCSQVVMLGGHLTAPPQAGGVYPGSIGIDYQQPSSVTSARYIGGPAHRSGESTAGRGRPSGRGFPWSS